MFQPKDRVVLMTIPMWPYSGMKATFIRYRTEDELKEWRPDDDCWVALDNVISLHVFPSSCLSNISCNKQ